MIKFSYTFLPLIFLQLEVILGGLNITVATRSAAWGEDSPGERRKQPPGEVSISLLEGRKKIQH